MELYKCNYCDKEYKSISARGLHYNLKHKELYIKDKKNNKDKKIYMCEICNKEYSCRQSKYFHKKTCKKSDDHQELINENKQLKETLNFLLQNNKKPSLLLQKINTGTINNGTINNTINNTNTINIIKFGNEDLREIFTEKEILKILNHKKFSLEESIKAVHCNDTRPEYKNIYITNLRNDYAYTFDGNKFINVYKEQAISDLVNEHCDFIEETVETYKNKIPKDAYKILQKFIEQMNDEDTEFTHHEINKTYSNYRKYKIESVKLLIFNNTDKNIIKVIL
uniref:C2H2-type domain-containing protein n=1 Tax=viral metagenome TaxID=1070528 RepID=A0A6C0HVD7_9ZZZZ